MATSIKQIHGKVQKSFSANKPETTQLLAHAKVRDARSPTINRDHGSVLKDLL
jgi:hypothetical protein